MAYQTAGKDRWKRAASAIMGHALFDLDLGAAMGAGSGLIGSVELPIKRPLENATLARGILRDRTFTRRQLFASARPGHAGFAARAAQSRLGDGRT